MPLQVPRPGYKHQEPPAVAVDLPVRDRARADRGGGAGLSVPRGQCVVARVVVPQPLGQMAATGPALPDLLRHVRLHGHRLHRAHHPRGLCCFPDLQALAGCEPAVESVEL